MISRFGKAAATSSSDGGGDLPCVGWPASVASDAPSNRQRGHSPCGASAGIIEPQVGQVLGSDTVLTFTSEMLAGESYRKSGTAGKTEDINKRPAAMRGGRGSAAITDC